MAGAATRCVLPADSRKNVSCGVYVADKYHLIHARGSAIPLASFSFFFFFPLLPNNYGANGVSRITVVTFVSANGSVSSTTRYFRRSSVAASSRLTYIWLQRTRQTNNDTTRDLNFGVLTIITLKKSLGGM